MLEWRFVGVAVLQRKKTLTSAMLDLNSQRANRTVLMFCASLVYPLVSFNGRMNGKSSSVSVFETRVLCVTFSLNGSFGDSVDSLFWITIDSFDYILPLGLFGNDGKTPERHRSNQRV